VNVATTTVLNGTYSFTTATAPSTGNTSWCYPGNFDGSGRTSILCGAPTMMSALEA